MTAPEYLYGYGSKKHIRNPDHVLPEAAYCGSNARSEDLMERNQLAWFARPVALRHIDRIKARSVCKLCQKAWDKRVAS